MLTDILKGLTGQTWEVKKCCKGMLSRQAIWFSCPEEGECVWGAKSACRPPWKKVRGEWGHTCKGIKQNKRENQTGHSSLALVGKELDCSVPTLTPSDYRTQPSPKIIEAEQEHVLLIIKEGKVFNSFLFFFFFFYCERELKYSICTNTTRLYAGAALPRPGLSQS